MGTSYCYFEGLGHSSLTIDVAISSLQTTIFLTNNIPGVGLMLVILLVLSWIPYTGCIAAWMSIYRVLTLSSYCIIISTYLPSLFACLDGNCVTIFNILL
jgi:hypothetical protein